jgi:hypothetical protein
VSPIPNLTHFFKSAVSLSLQFVKSQHFEHLEEFLDKIIKPVLNVL